MNGMTKAIMLVLGFALIFGVVSAAPGGGAQVVKLVAKEPVTWTQINPGTFGSLMYQTDKFVFNGHGLTPKTDYTLINFIDPWGTGYTTLGNAITDKNGNILIKGEATTLTKYIYASDADGDYQDITGAKIWLVPTTDLFGGVLAWDPGNFLFETSLII